MAKAELAFFPSQAPGLKKAVQLRLVRPGTEQTFTLRKATEINTNKSLKHTAEGTFQVTKIRSTISWSQRR